MLNITPLQASDRAAWQPLAAGYKAFYKTPCTEAEYEQAWARLMDGHTVHGLGARRDGQLVGMAHYLFHASTWAPAVCYLQDLFTVPASRGGGVGRALIDAVAQQARAQGAARYYWLTQDHNAVARGLYDRIARHNGFIRYDFDLAL